MGQFSYKNAVIIPDNPVGSNRDAKSMVLLINSILAVSILVLSRALLPLLNFMRSLAFPKTPKIAEAWPKSMN